MSRRESDRDVSTRPQSRPRQSDRYGGERREPPQRRQQSSERYDRDEETSYRQPRPRRDEDDDYRPARHRKKPVDQTKKDWVYWSIITALICVCVMVFTMFIVIILRPSVAPYKGPITKQPPGMRAAQEGNPRSFGGLDENTVYEVSTMSMGIETGDYLYATPFGLDCSQSGLSDGSCWNVTTVQHSVQSNDPIYWQFIPNILNGETVYIIRIVPANNGSNGGFISFKQAMFMSSTNLPTGNNDCVAAGYSNNCFNASMVNSDIWTRPSLQLYWRLVSVLVNGKEYFRIMPVTIASQNTQQNLYFSAGGRDCQSATSPLGASVGCKNVFTVNDAAFSKSPVYWKLDIPQ